MAIARRTSKWIKSKVKKAWYSLS